MHQGPALAPRCTSVSAPPLSSRLPRDAAVQAPPLQIELFSYSVCLLLQTIRLTVFYSECRIAAGNPLYAFSEQNAMLTYVGPTEKIHIRWPDPQGNCSEEVPPENGIAKRRRVCERCCPRLAGLVWTPFPLQGPKAASWFKAPGRAPQRLSSTGSFLRLVACRAAQGKCPGRIRCAEVSVAQARSQNIGGQRAERPRSFPEAAITWV